MRYVLYAFVAVLMLVAVLFAVSNLHDMDVFFEPFPWRATAPVYAWILLTFVIGFFAGWLASWLHRFGARHRDHVLARRAEPLEKEVTELRQRLDSAEKAQPETVPADRQLTAAGQ